MKWIASMLVICGTFGYGYSVLEEEKRMIQILECQERIISMLKGEITHFHKKLSEAFQCVGEKTGGMYGDFLQTVARRMQAWNGEGVREIWLQELEKVEKNHNINNKLHMEFNRLVQNIDFEEYTMQVEAFEYIRNAVEKEIKDRRERVKQNQKWILWFCTLLGILCVIVLL